MILEDLKRSKQANRSVVQAVLNQLLQYQFYKLSFLLNSTQLDLRDDFKNHISKRRRRSA